MSQVAETKLGRCIKCKKWAELLDGECPACEGEEDFEMDFDTALAHEQDLRVDESLKK